MKTQKEWAINQLIKQGEVTRNSALQNYISRLGAIVCDLQKEGWELKGENRKEKYSKDFVYYLIKSPYKKQEYLLPDGTLVSKLIKL